MKIIGITGPIGSGKSYVAQMFANKGLAHLDTDEIYHELVSCETDCTKQIKEYFGSGVISADGSVDRKALGRIVFNNREKLNALNKIAHACVEVKTKELLAELEEKGTRAVVVEVPLMFESGFDKMCDTVVCVIADYEIRVGRIMQRNSLTREEAELRMKNQSGMEFYTERSNYTVKNNGDEELDEQIEGILKNIGL